jgi:iron complex outermembrane receptor protein
MISRSRCALLGASFIALTRAAGAQEAARVDSVVVTAPRRLDETPESASRLGLSNRETPAIVDVLTQEDLQTQGARTAIEAMNAAPGVNAGNLPGAIGGASMRGFTRGAVNDLYDGVRMASSGAEVRNWDAWSFERVEVLKGPSSVISGEGALAGAINFVPREPSLGAWGGGFLVSYGEQDTARLAGGLNAPLGEHAALRADLALSRSAGWVADTDSETHALTRALRLEPTERLTVTLRADRFEDDFSTAYFGLPLVPRANARAASDIVSGGAGLVADEAMAKINYNVGDGAMDSQSTWLRANAAYRLTSNWKLVSDSSWYDADRLWRNSEDYTFNAGTGLIDRTTTLITHDHSYWNQRLHAAYDGSLGALRNRFTVGAEFGGTDFGTVRRFGTASSVDQYAPLRGAFPTTDNSVTFATRQNVTAAVESSAVFFEDALNITPNWLLVAGARADSIDLTRRIQDLNAGTLTEYGAKYDPVSWRVGTVYSVTPETQLFAQYSRAVSPVSGLLFVSAANARFDLTHGDAVEAGIKTSLANGAALTASLFHIRQDDILTRDPFNPALTIQGGAQQSNGAEVSLDWPVTEALSVSLGAMVVDAEFVELIETGGVNRAGNRPPNTPARLADLTATYASPSSDVSFTASVRHMGDFYTSNANTVRVEEATLLDAAITWEAPFGALSLRGRNLTDEFYADWSGFSSTQIYLGAPRAFEISLTRSF